MKRHYHKIGAIAYMLWGLLHIVGGMMLYLTLKNEGITNLLYMLGTAIPKHHVPEIASGSTVDGLAAFHAWNITGFGIISLLTAIMLNWKNNRTGYWMNLGVVATADLGLVFTLIIPGYMHLTDGLPGIILFLLALTFSTLGFKHSSYKLVN